MPRTDHKDSHPTCTQDIYGQVNAVSPTESEHGHPRSILDAPGRAVDRQ